MTYNTTISHLHGRPCTWRPESWRGIDAWVPQGTYCKTAAVGKRKCSKNCGGWKLGQIRQMKVKAELNITSSEFFTPSNLHTSMSLSEMHLCEFVQLSTNLLFRFRSQISGLIFRSAEYTDALTKFKRSHRDFSSFEDNLSFNFTNSSAADHYKLHNRKTREARFGSQILWSWSFVFV